MTARMLRYTGPLPECGLTGPATGLRYLARAGEVISVAVEDVPGLLKRYGAVLAEYTPRARRRDEPEPADAAADTAVSAQESDVDGEVDGQDAA